MILQTAAIAGIMSAVTANPMGYDEATAAPTPTHDAPEDTQNHFDQYWKNLELCDFNYGLSTCLLGSHDDKQDFLHEDLTLKCTVDAVNDFCGEQLTTPEIDLGSVHVDEKNCHTSAYASSLLVYQKLITHWNAIVGLTPSVKRMTVTKTHLALQITRSNADCAMDAFFHFLHQASKSNFISEKDMQCLDEHLTDSQCDFAEDVVEDWNLPSLVRRYGLFGYTKMVEQMEESYQVMTDDAAETTTTAIAAPSWLQELQRMITDDVQGLHVVDTEYDAHTQEASINVCPQNFHSMNSAFAATGIEGTEASLVAFHFPSAENVTFEGQEVAVDPIYDRAQALDTCHDWFDFSREHFELVETGDLAADHLKSRCFAIKGYDIFFIESNRTEPLSYEHLPELFAGVDDKCYKASWKELQSCSSHLTEWRMHLSCCTSYAEYYAKQLPTPHVVHHGYDLLKASTPYYQSYPEPEYNHHEYAPASPYHPVDPADLLFEKTVVSKSGAGSLASIDARTFAERKPESVIRAIDAGVATLVKDCAKLEALFSAGYFGHHFEQFCAKVDFHAEQIDIDDTQTLLSANDYAPEEYSYYVEDDIAAVEIGETLNIDLDFAAIVPLVSGKCFPRACVLSQLASCMEQPDAVYTYEPPMPEYAGQSGNTFYADPNVA